MAVRFRFISFPILVLFLCAANNMFGAELTKIKSFGSNPGNLEMFVYTPKEMHGTGPRPLVMVLHGCLQNANRVAEQTGWNKLADLYGFEVLYPQTKITNNIELCFDWFKSADINKGGGECESIKQMIDYMRADHSIDSTKIFVTGLSAGAAMGVVMMATHPEIFNAGAIFAGGAYKAGTNVFTASLAMQGWILKSPKNWGDLVRKQNPNYGGPYPRVIVYQGRQDRVVNRRNAGEIIKQWANLHGISEKPGKTEKRFEGIKAITRMSYLDSSRNEVLVYYQVKHLGHALLIDPGQGPKKGGKRGIFSRDKNFHSTYWTAFDFGLIPKILKAHIAE